MSVAEVHGPVAGPASHSDEWYKLRTFDPERKRPVIIGASEIAVACGVSPYSTPLQLYLEKRGEMDKEFTDEQQERMDFGTKIEPVIIEAYAERTGVEVDADVPMFFHPDYEWMAATPDAIVVGNVPSVDWGLECKNTTSRMFDASGENENCFGEEGTDFVPQYMVVQCQSQMAVMGFNRVDMPVLFDGSKLRIYTIERNEDIIDAIIARGEELAARIVNGDPPEATWEHEGTKDALAALYGYDKDAPAVEMSADIDGMVWKAKDLGAEIKALEKKQRELKNRITSEFHGAARATLPNGEKLSRTVIADTYVTDKDVEEFAARVGQVKKRGHERLNLPRKRKAE